MKAPNPQEWYEKEPYISSVDCKYHHECEECSGEYGGYDIPAIIAETRRMMKEEVRKILEESYAREADLNKHCGDKPMLELCKDCVRGNVLMSEYQAILSRLQSL